MQANKIIKNHISYFVAATVISVMALMIDVNSSQPAGNEQASHMVMNFVNKELQNW